ncbi:MAG TPA: DUF2723 domain-containing protein [Actinobacteria bacterium]|nr:DUF2723 domain-containing protein [Actinomycetota bacterium]
MPSGIAPGMSEGAPVAPDRAGAWNGTDWLITATLFIATVLSRLPFRTGLLYAWDSVLYTRAMDHFDVTIQQPQPPGHIFYVGFARLVEQFTGDANAAMVWISLLASAAAVVALYWLGRAMLGRSVGLVAALFLATSLSFWGHGEIAYPYTLLAFLSVFLAGVMYRAWQGGNVCALLSGLCLGLAAGFRQDLLPFLLPLWAGGLLGKPRRVQAGSVGLLGLAAASWYVPSALLSGGFSAYQEASSVQSDYLMRTSSVFGQGLEALAVNLQALGRFLLYALSAALPFAILAPLLLVRRRYREQLGNRKLLFLLVWTVPSVLFYIFIHIGEFGYVFTFLPAVLLMASWGVVVLARDMARALSSRRWPHRRERLRPAVMVALVLPVIVLNMLLFLVLTPHLSAERLAANEDIQRSRIETIREYFDADSTLVVSVFNYQQASYYLPEFEHWYIDPVTAGREVLQVPQGIKWVVLFDESLEPGEGEKAMSFPLARKQRLFYLEPVEGTYLIVDWPARRIYNSNSW